MFWLRLGNRLSEVWQEERLVADFGERGPSIEPVTQYRPVTIKSSIQNTDRVYVCGCDCVWVRVGACQCEQCVCVSG